MVGQGIVGKQEARTGAFVSSEVGLGRLDVHEVSARPKRTDHLRPKRRRGQVPRAHDQLEGFGRQHGSGSFPVIKVDRTGRQRAGDLRLGMGERRGGNVRQRNGPASARQQGSVAAGATGNINGRAGGKRLCALDNEGFRGKRFGGR